MGSVRLQPLASSWLRHQLRYARCGGRTERSPDRLILVEGLLPAFADHCARILWIGVRRYTAAYPAALERNGAACWTLDIDPAARRWGHPRRHLTCDLLRLADLDPQLRFDAVLCNGVFGYGVDTPERQQAAVRAMGAAIADGGWLMLGWNSHRVQDPLPAALATGLFRPTPLAGLSPRLEVAGTTHVFDILRRAAAPPPPSSSIAV
jgi:hypothetical protein